HEDVAREDVGDGHCLDARATRLARDRHAHVLGDVEAARLRAHGTSAYLTPSPRPIRSKASGNWASGSVPERSGATSMAPVASRRCASRTSRGVKWKAPSAVISS